jgi:mannose/fructose-specific phosphotransferase system component IIA
VGEPSRLPRGIIITHGALGEELRRTAELVIGHAEGLDTLSNAGLSTAALAEQVDALLAGEAEDRPVMLFVDLLGGSCAQACAEQLTRRRGSRLFTGVNLPMIIAFLQYRETMSADELAAGILMRAHRGITAFPELTAGAPAEPRGVA